MTDAAFQAWGNCLFGRIQSVGELGGRRQGHCAAGDFAKGGAAGDIPIHVAE
jgi:hypothetical protein